MAKYKVGDKVRVRSDLKMERYTMEDGITTDLVVVGMMRFAGQVVTIKSVYRKYRIEEYDCNWTDEMFEGLALPESECDNSVKDDTNISFDKNIKELFDLYKS